jgi:uncharacterized protein
MSYRSPKGFTGWSQFGILFAFVGVGLILAGIAQVVIGFMIADPKLSVGDQLKAMATDLLKPENIFSLQLSQAISTFLLMFIPAFIYTRICYGRDKLWMGFSPRINGWQILIGFVVIIAANIAAGLLADLSKQILSNFPAINKWAQQKENEYNDLAIAISSIKGTWGAYFTGLVIMAFLPAIFEEVLFRGALQNLLVRWLKAPVVAIIITACVFSFIHGTVYSFLSRALLGFVLGWLYYRSKNIWVSILAHFFNNALVVTQLFVIARSGEKLDLSKLDESAPLWLEILAVMAIYGLFVLYEKVCLKNREAIEADEQKLWAAAEARNKDNWNNY